MVILDDLKDLLLYKKDFILPINPKNKKYGSAIMLLTASRKSSILAMTKPYMINKNFFESYYVEKDITKLIQNEAVIEDDPGEYLYDALLESVKNYSLDTLSKRVGSNIHLSGYEKDVNVVKYYIEKDSIDKCFDRMNARCPSKVSLIVTSDPNTPQTFTNDSVTIYTPSTFEKMYPNVDYQDYIDYTLQLYAIYTLKNRKKFIITSADKSRSIVSIIAEPAAIVLSGVADKSIRKTDGFDNKLDMEKALQYILDKEGITFFMNVIRSNDIATIFKYYKEYLAYIKSGDKSLYEYFEFLIEEANDAKANSKESANKNKNNLKNLSTKLKKQMRNASIYKLNKAKKDANDNSKGANNNGQSQSSTPSSTLNNNGGNSNGTNNNSMKQQQVKEMANGDYIQEGDYLYLFENSSKYDNILRQALYKDRFKNNKQVLNLYDKIKEEAPFIKYTFTDIGRYKTRNLFIDLSYYNESFFRNLKSLNIEDKTNSLKLCEIYTELMERLLKDDKLKDYSKRTIFIPILEWQHNNEQKMWIYKNDINPISIIYYLIKHRAASLKEIFGVQDVVFLGGQNYFKINFAKTDFSTAVNINKFLLLIQRVVKLGYNNADPDPDGTPDSSAGIAMDIVDKVEKSQNVEINDVSKIIKDKNGKEIQPNTDSVLQSDKANNDTSEEDKKNAIVGAIAVASKGAESTTDAINKLDTDEFKSMVVALQNDSRENVRIDKMQASNVINMQSEFHKKQVAGQSVQELLEKNSANETLKETALPVASINEDWKKMKFMNFEKDYDMNSDIVKMLDSMQHWTFPIAVKNIDIKDNSTADDLADLWTIECVDYKKSRFTLKVDVPKFVKGSNNLRLRGNDKLLMIQSALLPIIKTNLEECQIIGTGGYNKIFVRKFGSRAGQSVPAARNLLRALSKCAEQVKNIKVVFGDNTRICAQYQLPVDYIDLSSCFNSVETKNLKIYFNQDELRAAYTVDDIKGVPFGVKKEYSTKDKKEVDTILYFDGKSHNTMAGAIASLLMDIPEFEAIWDGGSIAGANCSYSKAKILNTEIPVVLICAYLEGLITTMNKAGIKYRIEKQLDRSIRHSDMYDYIKFANGYIIYEVTYSSSLLMCGLKMHDTESYNLEEMNKQMMYIDFFNTYGNYITSGLENSYDCMLDPITKEILAKYKLPTDYVGVLIHASNLLADNKYIRHIDQSGRRWRRKELIAGYFYKALTDAYQTYSNSLRNNRKGMKMSIKQSAIIDFITGGDPATTDLTINAAVNDLESLNTVTNKGIVGMNVSRGYTIATRGYDDSMINLLGMDTGFTGTVGINRQATINANVEGGRGFVKAADGKSDKMSAASTLTMTEALTPFGCTHDDPMRTLMSFVQTSKHMMRCDNNDPTLVTTGANEALPYLTSDLFAFKAKQDGKVVEIVEEGPYKQNYIVVQYKDKSYDYVNLNTEIKKNSDGGYFVALKLDTDLKVGKSFKSGDVLAYDRLSFTNTIGESNNLAATVGTLAKVAIMNTDEGYEDAAAVTERFASRIGTDVVQEVETRLSKGTNIFIYKEIGDQVMEGDTLFATQADFDDDVANMLLKNLTIDQKQLSELGRNPVKTPYTGTIADIVIYRTCEFDEMSESLQKFVTKHENKLNKTKKIYDKYKIDSSAIPKAGKVQEVGRAKGLDDAIMIVYYIKYNDKVSVGDKIVFYSANKGVVKYVIPDDEAPYTEFRPNEPVDTFMSLSAISGRMTFSSVTFAATSKLMVELDRSIKDMAGIPWDDTQV